MGGQGAWAFRLPRSEQGKVVARRRRHVKVVSSPGPTICALSGLRPGNVPAYEQAQRVQLFFAAEFCVDGDLALDA